MNPGVYLIEGGGFKVTGTGTLIADRVMIYNTSGPAMDADQVVISGDATVDWTPPDSGIYAGIAIFNDRSITNKKIEISGNGNTQITGTVYGAGAEVQLSGNGPTDVLGGAFIVYSMQVSGDGTFNIGDEDTGRLGATVYLVE